MKEFFARLWDVLKRAAIVWARVVNTVLLGIVYFTVFGLTSLSARLLGQDLLGVRPRPKSESLWRDWEAKDVDLESCLHQF